MRWQPTFFYGWVIVAVVFLAEFMASGMGTLTIGLFFAPLSEDMGWSLTQLTSAVTAQSIASLMIAPLVGPAIDRFGARAVMLFGAVSAGIGLILLGHIEALWQFLVLYALVGALGLHELGNLTGPVVVSKWFVRRRGRAMALATLGTLVGGMVMSPIIGVLIETIGWRGTWQIMGITVLVVAVIPIAILMRRQPEDIGLLPDGGTVDAGQGQVVNKESEQTGFVVEEIWTLKEAFRTRTLWFIIVAMNLATLAASVQIIHTAPFLTQQEGMSTGSASLVITARLVVAALSRLPWGFLVERIPVRICLALAFAGRSLGLLVLVVLPFPINLPFFIILSAVAGALGLLQPMILADYFGRSFQGTIQGVIRPFLAGPGLLVPLLVAFLYDTTGSFDTAFLLVSVPGLVAIGLVLMATPPVKR